MIHLNICQNIVRAAQLNNSSEGCDSWVWEVSVQRDFETNMIFDSNSFLGFTYKEVKSILQTEAELNEEYVSGDHEEYEDENES